MPRLKWPHHEHAGMPLDGGVPFAPGTGNLRSVPGLRVVMREHAPHPPQHHRWHFDAVLADVALEEGADEVLLPGAAVLVGPGQKGPRKPSAPPKPPRGVRANLGEIESAGLDESDPAGQRFGTLAE